MAEHSIDVMPLAGALGAEIAGVDLAHGLDPGTADSLRKALWRHGVIFLRDQRLDVEQQKAVARLFGEIFIHPNFRNPGDDPEVVMVRRNPGDAAIIGEEWHSDTAMMESPPLGAVLYGVEIPPYGGDTLFASQYAAYEALSPTMQRLLEGLKGENSDRNVAGPYAALNARRSTKVREDESWRPTTHLHPVVRTHPETGRKALFVSRPYTLSLEGMTQAESRALLEFLFQHSVRPEFTCRFRWTAGAVAIWDNRCTMHLAVNDAGPFPRLMRRVQIAGNRPF